MRRLASKLVAFIIALAIIALGVGMFRHPVESEYFYPGGKYSGPHMRHISEGGMRFVGIMFAIFGIGILATISGIIDWNKFEEVDKESKRKSEPPKPMGKHWKCPKCGETSEPQFNSCWKCGAARKDDHAA